MGETNGHQPRDNMSNDSSRVPRGGAEESSDRSPVVAVVGCGLMGCGIAEVAAVAGLTVVAVKATAGDVAPIRSKIERSLERAVKGGKMTEQARDEALARITFTSDIGAVAAADIVIESAVESAIPKKRLLAELERAMRADAVLASNTSSLPLRDLADALTDPGRFLALHFFSPVPMMKLLEVSATRSTRPEVLDRAMDLARILGKTAVLVSDTPGYVVNRLLVPLLLHAIETLEAGVAPPDSIDAAMKLGCGHPMGPLALCDLIGLDIVLAMAKTLSSELNDPRYRPPTLLRRLVLEGNLGRKTKLGFYDYSSKEPVPNPGLERSTGMAAIASVA